MKRATFKIGNDSLTSFTPSPSHNVDNVEVIPFIIHANANPVNVNPVNVNPVNVNPVNVNPVNVNPVNIKPLNIKPLNINPINVKPNSYIHKNCAYKHVENIFYFS